MKAARLVVLGVALAAGGIAAFLVAGGEEEKKEVVVAPPPPPVIKMATVDVLIARADIGMGVAVKGEDFQWQEWPAASTGDTFVTKKTKPNAIEEFSGAITRAPFAAREPIREAKLIKANGAAGFMAAILPSGMRAVSTEISPETGAGGFILPNDRVDVILTKRPNRDSGDKNETTSSETILSNVRVLAIDQTVEERKGERVVVGKTATLELSPRQAETLVLSRQLGTLSLALRSLLDASQPAGDTDDKNDRKTGINTVRFGVPSTSK
jgi:pilus assembly protein CpaB